jgi:GT2 family glycosyltransferase
VACETAHHASPDLPIVVIDASSTSAAQEACAKLQAGLPTATIYYHRAAIAGLTRQRNQAAAICSRMDAKYVHFIDDDTTVMPRYFDAIEDRFRRDPLVIGLGGIILDQPLVRLRAVKIAFLLASRRPGVVLRSGRHTLGQYPGSSAGDQVDWLSGCSMSFRVEVFTEFQFDESLSGYSMGEDADFSFRVSRKHRLAVEPGATCMHSMTPTDRGSARVRRREATVNSYRRVLQYRSFGLSRAAYWWATLGDVMIRGSRWLATRDQGSLGEVKGTVDGIRAILTGVANGSGQ